MLMELLPSFMERVAAWLAMVKDLKRSSGLCGVMPDIQIMQEY